MMSTTKPGAYRKKKWSSTNLPVSQSMVENLSASSWQYFTGALDGASVIVTCTGDMDFLYEMGFFGKGSLSRSEPNFNKTKQKVTLDLTSSTQGDSKVQKLIMSKRNYLLHTHYKDLLESNMQDLDPSIGHKDPGKCSSSQKKPQRKPRNQSTRVPAKQTAAVFSKVPSEMFPKLTSVLELASRLNTSRSVASYVCVSKSLQDLSYDALVKLKATQCSRAAGAVSEADSVLILDSDEERSQDIEVCKDKNWSKLGLNKGTDTVLTSERTALKLNSVTASEPLKKNNREVNSEEAKSGLFLDSDISLTGISTNPSDIGQAPDTNVHDQIANNISQESDQIPSLSLGTTDTSGDIDKALSNTDTSWDIVEPFGNTDTSVDSAKPLGNTDTSRDIVEPFGNTDTSVDSAKPLGNTDTSRDIAKLLDNTDSSEDIRIANPLGNTDTSGNIAEPIQNTDSSGDIAKPIVRTVASLDSAQQVNVFSTKFQDQFPAVEKELMNLLSCLSKSKEKNFVVRPTIFMYISSHQPTYLSAMLKLYSTDPVMHFDYSCDTSQLPIAFTLPEENMSYLRLFPTVEWNASSSALSNRVIILNQSSVDVSGVYSVLNSMKKTSSEHPPNLQVKNLDLESIASDAKVKMKHHSTSCCLCSSLRESHVLAYLGIYKHSEGGDDTGSLSESEPTENHTPSKSKEHLRKTVMKLLTIFQSNGDNTLVEEKIFLSEFHTQLSKYLGELDLSHHSEFFLLCSLLSCNEKLTHLSHEEILSLHHQLTEFQLHLIQSRYLHLMNDPSTDLRVSSSSSQGKESLAGDDINASPSEISKKRHWCDPQDVGSLDSKKLKQFEDITRNTIEEMHSEDITKNTMGTMVSAVTKDQNVNLSASEQASQSKCELPCEESIQSNLFESDNIQLEQEVESETMSEKLGTHSTQVGSRNSQAKLSLENAQSNDLVITEQICIDSSSDEEFSCPPRVHPYSVYDDEDQADYLVMSNTSDEEEKQHGKRKWQPCLKKDPYPVTESLHLMLEEAFFLSYGLGCLCVTDADKKVLNLTQMWQKFQQLKDRFIPHYAVYHYFRSKGWVPKSGLKFGCDFILYRDGPPFYHGSYSVVVTTVKERNILPHLKNDSHVNGHLLSWPGFSAVNRVNDQVAKTLMLCYVIWPEEDFSEEDLLSPNCLKKLKLKEVIISRWVPAQERDAQLKEDIP